MYHFLGSNTKFGFCTGVLNTGRGRRDGLHVHHHGCRYEGNVWRKFFFFGGSRHTQSSHRETRASAHSRLARVLNLVNVRELLHDFVELLWKWVTVLPWLGSSGTCRGHRPEVRFSVLIPHRRESEKDCASSS